MHLTPAQTQVLLSALEARFQQNPHRHEGIPWPSVVSRLAQSPAALFSLSQMEETGGEPDLTAYDPTTGVYTFCDMAPETPPGRRNLCYDDEALAARKQNKPQGSAMGTAAQMGITLLTPAQYAHLQALDPLDQRTSSWLLTPPQVRRLGGALFGDRRYGQVFTCHNGADSYYGARGFRGMLEV